MPVASGDEANFCDVVSDSDFAIGDIVVVATRVAEEDVAVVGAAVITVDGLNDIAAVHRPADFVDLVVSGGVDDTVVFVAIIAAVGGDDLVTDDALDGEVVVVIEAVTLLRRTPAAGPERDCGVKFDAAAAAGVTVIATDRRVEDVAVVVNAAVVVRAVVDIVAVVVDEAAVEDKAVEVKVGTVVGVGVVVVEIAE